MKPEDYLPQLRRNRRTQQQMMEERIAAAINARPKRPSHQQRLRVPFTVQRLPSGCLLYQIEIEG